MRAWNLAEAKVKRRSDSHYLTLQGTNLPVTPDQIKQGLGGDFLSQLAGKAGVSPDAESAQLSSLLPDLIDKVTPNGKIETGGVDQLLKMFQGKMGA
ncbi:MAG: YidB family protein [Nitrospirota bacterium]